MREKSIEEKLVDAVKAVGGVCWKFTSPGTAGVPDRCSACVSEHFGGWASKRLCWTAQSR